MAEGFAHARREGSTSLRLQLTEEQRCSSQAASAHQVFVEAIRTWQCRSIHPVDDVHLKGILLACVQSTEWFRGAVVSLLCLHVRQNMQLLEAAQHTRTVNHMLAVCVEVELCWGNLNALSCCDGR